MDRASMSLHRYPLRQPAGGRRDCPWVCKRKALQTSTMMEVLR